MPSDNAHHTPVAPMPFPTPGRTTAVPGAPSIEQLNRAATELLPYLRAEAQNTEQARRVSERTTAMFREAGFFKLMQPARYGGYEYGFTAFVDIVSELARACTSSGWGCSLGAVHQWMMGTFAAEAQDDVWGRNPDAIACVSYAPTVIAERAPGGWKIQGQWHWASNVDNSQWAILGVQFPAEDKGAPPSMGFLLVPRSDWRVEDNWFVAGQAGTGSKAVAIDSPVFVPEHRRLGFAEASSGQPPGAAHNPNPLYRIPFLSAVPTCLAAPLLGTAQGAVDAFIDLCGNRITRGAVAGGGNRLSQFFPVQSRVAEAAACVDAARLLLYRDTAEVEQMAIAGRPVDVATRIRNRRDHAFSARLSQQAVEAVFSAVGGAGLALDQPLQRMWRDANAIVRHISLNWDAVSSMTGQFMLGLEPKGQY
jgi:resorcinol 4-hydroxylase (FADH2)